MLKDEWPALVALEKGLVSPGFEPDEARAETLRVAMVTDLSRAGVDEVVEIVEERLAALRIERKREELGAIF